MNISNQLVTFSKVFLRQETSVTGLSIGTTKTPISAPGYHFTQGPIFTSLKISQ